MRGPRLRLVLGLLVLLALALTLLDTRAGTGGPLEVLRRGATTVFGPVQRGVGGGLASGGRVLGDLPRLAGYREDNARLQRENAELRRRLLEQEGAQAQAEQVRELLRLKDAGSYTTVLARVVGVVVVQPVERTVTLDVGDGDGIRPGQTVTSGRGLVGRTVRVDDRTTVVALLTDETFSVGARLNTAPGSFGVARGRGPLGLGFSLVELGRGAVLRPGDALVTAGSDTFAPGVPVGRITSVDPASGSPVRTASVEPYADLGALDLLQVIVEGPRTTPRVPIPPR